MFPWLLNFDRFCYNDGSVEVLRDAIVSECYYFIRYRRWKIRALVRKSRLAKACARRHLRVIFLMRASSSILLLKTRQLYYSRKFLVSEETVRVGLCVAVNRGSIPFFTTFLLRNRIFGECLDYRFAVFSPANLVIYPITDSRKSAYFPRRGRVYQLPYVAR